MNRFYGRTIFFLHTSAQRYFYSKMIILRIIAIHLVINISRKQEMFWLETSKQFGNIMMHPRSNGFCKTPIGAIGWVRHTICHTLYWSQEPEPDNPGGFFRFNREFCEENCIGDIHGKNQKFICI